jgi:hypothetical protein
MIVGLLLSAALQTAAINWDALPSLPFRTPPAVTPEMQAFVKREVVTRKCPVSAEGAVQIDVAVLIDENNTIRASVPKAMQCPTVEQYASGLVAAFASNNLLPRTGTGEQWYRTSLSFTVSK